MRSLRSVVVLVCALSVLVFTALPAAAVHDPVIAGGTSSERETVREAWHLVLDSFPRLRGCMARPIPDVEIRSWSHVGTYDYPRDTIILRSGGFALADAVHEFAHHVDWECGFVAEDEELLFATTDLDGYLKNTGWRYSPLEIFAETVVKIVLGPGASSAGGRASRLHPGPDLQKVVIRWADSTEWVSGPRFLGRFAPIPR